MNESPSIGQVIRALRMGFGWSNHCQGFIRISGDGPFKFEFHPLGLIPNSFKSSTPYRKWWPCKDEPGIPILEAPFVRSLRKIKRHFIAYLDDNGNPS